MNPNDHKIELLVPAGGLANLKAAVVSGADAVYFGLRKFGARSYAKNISFDELDEALRICKSNNVKAYVTLNTVIKNNELREFFKITEKCYANGVDAFILQDVALAKLLKDQLKGVRIHISTQAGVMNVGGLRLFDFADRINLARELKKQEIEQLRKSTRAELEIFCHGALCFCVSGQCLFSSFIGGRSGNRGKCAQPCRKYYNSKGALSTKELNLIDEVPSIINIGINSIKIEGRMRTPYYTATVTGIYRKAIDSYYEGNFQVSKQDRILLKEAFSRDFTKGFFGSEQIVGTNCSGIVGDYKTEQYRPRAKPLVISRQEQKITLPRIEEQSKQKKELIVVADSRESAMDAEVNGADIIYYDIFAHDFKQITNDVNCKVYALTPSILIGETYKKTVDLIENYKPKGIVARNNGMILGSGVKDIHLDRNLNVTNDIDLQFYEKKNVLPIISCELSIKEILELKQKNFMVFVHGKIKLMTTRVMLKEQKLVDERRNNFCVTNTQEGKQIENEKEFGLLSKAELLLRAGIKRFVIEPRADVGRITRFYRELLDGKKPSDKELKKKYVLGWAFRGVM